MNELLFISFYTEGYYGEVINKYLYPSLQKFSLPCKIYKKPSLHDWTKNGKQKYEVIYNQLITDSRNIIFLDADAEIIQFPELFCRLHGNYDIAIHYLDWYLFWKNIPNQSKRDLLGATIYINNNKKTQELFKTLYEQTQKSSVWGQRLLSDLLKKENSEINCFDLPIEYCQIIKKDGVIPENTVIAQWAASRTSKFHPDL